MTASGERYRRRRAPLLAVFLLAAITFGFAAALLAGTPTPQAGGSPVFVRDVNFDAGLLITGAIMAGLVALWLFSLFRHRQTSDLNVLATWVLPFLVVVGVLLAGLVVASLLNPIGTPIPGSGTGTNPGNTTPPPPPNGTSNGALFHLPPWSPGWIPFLVVGVVAVALVVLVLPILLASRSRSRTASLEDPGAGRGALERAIRTLDADPNADPRSRIIALYAELLRRAANYLDRWESLTPREIETACVRVWHLPPVPAHDLTRLFEEARYSEHPIPEASVDTARGALREALAALPRPRGAP